MRIVILDGHTVNPGDLSWAPVSALGELSVFDRTERQLIAGRCADATIVLSNKTPLMRQELDALPSLRYIGVLATGYNNIDVQAATLRGITVSNIPGYGTPSVAQTVFAHILEHTNRIALHSEAVRRGEWEKCADFSFTSAPVSELSGKTMGLVGLGSIGNAVADIALAFGMRVIAFTPSMRPSHPKVTVTDLDRLLRESDIVSLHCPLTASNRGMIGTRELSIMKPSAILINTARGPLVDEPALRHALDSGRIAGAGVDVLSHEPPCDGNPLIGAPNCTVTPHIAWASREARTRLIAAAASNIRAYLDGKPQNRVSP